MSATIFGTADVAVALGVTRSAVSNYLARYDDTPSAQYKTPDGRLYWSAVGVARWLAWRDSRRQHSLS